ncbi:hypothetical protein B0T16DRAFT_414501 [Cercophora newfieldiana]|uniref:Uncharacterized protein n=1 Tax=Cercophora newfieldiana TaxID=92897 RepID=A0AA39Y6P6_9PEZI|nr:hypothetical protein B0T16DRAFT_414501 [Cercophora newfieldiana]
MFITPPSFILAPPPAWPSCPLTRVSFKLEDLLDLKQKQANVFEARTTRVSGNTITVFTIATIIFLPASFMATFLALPLKEYPTVVTEGEGEGSGSDEKMELDFAAKYTIIVTAAMAAPFVIFAIYVNPILRVANSVKEPLARAWRRIVKAWGYAVVVGLALSFVVLFCFRQAKLIGALAWGCVKMGFALVRKIEWKAVYRWVKGMRQAKKEALEEGVEWSKRQYVVRWLLGRWQVMLGMRKTRETDVEDQRSRSSVSTADGSGQVQSEAEGDVSGGGDAEGETKEAGADGEAAEGANIMPDGGESGAKLT